MRYLIFVNHEYDYYDCCSDCGCSGSVLSAVKRVLQVPDGVTNKNINEEFLKWFQSEYVKLDRIAKGKFTKAKQKLFEEWLSKHPDFKFIEPANYEAVEDGQTF